jgi:hypothetical protein
LGREFEGKPFPTVYRAGNPESFRGCAVLVPLGVGSPAFRRRGARKEGSIKIFHPLEIVNALPAEAGTPYPHPPDTGSSVRMRLGSGRKAERPPALKRIQTDENWQTMLILSLRSRAESSINLSYKSTICE